MNPSPGHFPSLQVVTSPVVSSGFYEVHANSLVCQLDVVFASSSDQQKVKYEQTTEGEEMGLVGQHGTYNGIFNASICSFNRCEGEGAEGCTTWIVDSDVLVKSFRLTAFINASNYLFTLPMMDTDQGQLFPSTLYTTPSYFSSPSSSYSFEISPDYVRLSVDLSEIERPLLNAAIFAVHHSYDITSK